MWAGGWVCVQCACRWVAVCVAVCVRCVCMCVQCLVCVRCLCLYTAEYVLLLTLVSIGTTGNMRM